MEEPADGDLPPPVVITNSNRIAPAQIMASHMGAPKKKSLVTARNKQEAVMTQMNKHNAVITQVNKQAAVNKNTAAFNTRVIKQPLMLAGHKKSGTSGSMRTALSVPQTYKVIPSSQSSGPEGKQNYVILKVTGNINQGQMAVLKQTNASNRAQYIINTVPRNGKHSNHVNVVVPTSQSVSNNAKHGHVTYVDSLKTQRSKNPLRVVMPTTSTQHMISKNICLRTEGLPKRHGSAMQSGLIPDAISAHSLTSPSSLYTLKGICVQPEGSNAAGVSGELSRSAEVDALGLSTTASLEEEEEQSSLLLPHPSQNVPAVIAMPVVPDLPCPDLADDEQNSLVGHEQSDLVEEEQNDLVDDKQTDLVDDEQTDVSKFLAHHSTTEALGLAESSSELSLCPQLAGVSGDAIGEDIMICDNTPGGIELETMAMEDAVDEQGSRDHDDVNLMSPETILNTHDEEAATSDGISPEGCDMLAISEKNTDAQVPQSLPCLPGPITDTTGMGAPLGSGYPVLPTPVLGGGSAPEPVDPAECLVCVDSATGRLVYINQEGHAFIDVSETGAAPVVSQEELTQAENSIQDNISGRPDGQQISLLNGESNTAVDIPGEVGAETVVVTTVTPSRKVLHRPAGKNVRVVQCNMQLPLDGDGERLKWPDYWLSDSDGNTSLPADDPVMVPHLTGVDSSDPMTCLRSSGEELTIREISKREKDRLMKRQQRQSEEFRMKERKQAKERMKARRKDPAYRQSEREKDKLRRRHARRTNNKLYAQERERDKVYQRQKRVLSKMSLGEPNVKIVSNYGFVESDLGAESCLS